MRYVICSTERTRGNLLCSLLRSIKVAGQPCEWNIEIIKDFIDHKRFLTQCTTDNILGLKLVSVGFIDISKYLDFGSFFDRYIYIRHPDPVWQAISFLRAEKVGKFADYNLHEGQQQASLNDSIWDMEISDSEISEEACDLRRYDKEWLNFFTSMNIEPLTIWYHELGTFEQQKATLGKLVEFLGIHKKYKFTKDANQAMFVQSDEWNEKTYEAYLSNFR